MTQEDKELLLKDLCSRLPYGVMCRMSGGGFETVEDKLTAIGLFQFVEEGRDVLRYCVMKEIVRILGQYINSTPLRLPLAEFVYYKLARFCYGRKK